MGKGTFGRERSQDAELAAFNTQVRERFKPIAIILHGSYASGNYGDWSDIDVIVISEKFEGMKIFDRTGELLGFTRGRIEPLGYTPEEFLSMIRKRNPLAINAALTGRPVFDTGFFGKAREFAESLKLERKGRMWIAAEGK